MHIPRTIVISRKRSNPPPAWLDGARETFQRFARNVDESRDLGVMDWFGITCRRMVAFLENPDQRHVTHLRNAIMALDAARGKSRIRTVPLPLTLSIIKRATNKDAVRTAAEALQPEIRNIFRFRIRT